MRKMLAVIPAVLIALAAAPPVDAQQPDANTVWNFGQCTSSTSYEFGGQAVQDYMSVNGPFTSLDPEFEDVLEPQGYKPTQLYMTSCTAQQFYPPPPQ